ncbi:hypothetical protein CPB83DRAFT_909881 [Crepidotus variabilis]|uniref:F-box domain-containing protein n=1 Tax=Crepidotus variabilis TaxID=179855 RepID=A0A9P6E8F2_9AGAR|nr:hypothetical protein CPB83DRAFT_909881 [Crepidotus variabilis]
MRLASLYLPQELIREILDNFFTSEDVHTLRSCSLVSSEFQDLAQSKLFHTITFELKSLERHLKIIENLQIILLTRPQLGSYIRHIWLHLSFEDPRWIHSNPTFLSIVEQCHNFEQLSMTGMGTGPFVNSKKWHSAFWEPIVQPRLKQLHIECIWDFPFTFNVGCSRLESLSLYSINFEESTSKDLPPILSSHKPLRLKHLRFQGSPNSPDFVASWNRENVDGNIKFTDLLTLDLRLSRLHVGVEIDWMSFVLSESGQSLNSMAISGQISKKLHLSLDSLTHLKKLTFGTDGLFKPSSLGDMMLTIAQILDGLHEGSSLRNLEIKLLAYIVRQDFLSRLASWECWPMMDAAFSRYQERAKDVIHIDFNIHCLPPDVISARVDDSVEQELYFSRIFTEKLPLTNENPFIEMLVYP